jgi:hypothetical protein
MRRNDVDVVVWNMHQDASNWALLGRKDALKADVHVLCEAPRPPKGVQAVGEWRTAGLEDQLPLDVKRKDRHWSTAVAARSKPTFITDARWARGYKAQHPLPFRPSRPGAWTAARVTVHGLPITVIALYGLLDEKSDASVHRSLSEFAPIFDHAVYGRHVLLGGDLNIVANPRPNDLDAPRHRAVLTRLEAYGLVNCVDLAERGEDEPFTDCPCGERPCTRHRRTFLREGAAAYQEDYLYASPRLVKRLDRCEVLAFQPSSDHAPIRATFTI